jgi:hypothetical protein
MDKERTPYRPFLGILPELKYVAFIDILGFKNSVQNNFDKMITVYQSILNHWNWHYAYSPNVSLRIYSDSLLLCSSDFVELISSIVNLCMVTLWDNFMVRGGIGYGKHMEVVESGNYYTLSHALIEAVQIEKTIMYPCVAISPKINIDIGWWDPRPSNFLRKILYFEDVIIVNPFNMAWGYSARSRVLMLLEQFPEYKEKYHWFLRLYEAVTSDEPLIPHWVIEQYGH